MRQRRQDIVSVTTARLSHTDDIRLRERRYVRMQLGRVACVLLAVLLPVPVWAKLLLFVGAMFLPWLGVVMANAGPVVTRERKTAITDRAALPEPAQSERLALDPASVVDGGRA